VLNEAAAHLAEAMRLHAEDRIDEALAAARRAIELDPSNANAHSYVGSTLVTRKAAYRAGLESVDRASQLAPDDAYIRYTTGWCYEYVAHEQERRASAGLPATAELRVRAIAEYRACLALDPPADLRDDVEKLLDRLDADSGA
jgi:tetratricopeptide (TPR) repeat protein